MDLSDSSLDDIINSSVISFHDGTRMSSIVIPTSSEASEDEDSSDENKANGSPSLNCTAYFTPPDEDKRLSWRTPKSSKKPKEFHTTEDSEESLVNSPVASTSTSTGRGKRDISKIICDVSKVTHDIESLEVVMSSVKPEDLPENGKPLMNRLEALEQQKKELKLEIMENQDYSNQKSVLKGFAMSTRFVEHEAPTKECSTHLISSEESEEDVVELDSPNDQGSTKEMISSEDSEEDEKKDSEENKTDAEEEPIWGAMPKPEMTLSGLGKRALDTHNTEKTLTVETLSSLHKALKSCPTEDVEEQNPKGLKVELMPHQRHALSWMLWREGGDPAGGILADDMGLGKTLTMISLILKNIQMEDSDTDSDSDTETYTWLHSKKLKLYPGGTLVVCPASVIGQWEKEIKKRIKRGLLSFELYHGNNREVRAKRLAQSDIVITTYNLVGRESAVDSAKTATVMKEKGPLFYIKWERVILDEAHLIRNHHSVTCQGVCELIAKHRWCLTGTPIQNKQLDLYALLKFLKCSPFDDLRIWKRWVDNKDAAGLRRLGTMIKAIMLRRTKEQLMSKGHLKTLSDKTYDILYVNLDPEELEVYEKISEYSKSLFAQFLAQRAEKQQYLDARYGFSSRPTWEQGERPDNQFRTTAELADLHRKMHGLKDVQSVQILTLLLRLRQSCCHPYLITQMISEDEDSNCGGDETNVDDLSVRMDAMNLFTDAGQSEVDLEFVAEEKKKRAKIMSINNPVFCKDRLSAKIRAVLDVLEEKVLGTSDKAIIVSQWTSFLSLISNFLRRRDISFDTLTGDIPVRKRADIIDAFNKSGRGSQVLLLSLTAGGVGLNLMGANHLLLIDIHWNPQLEAQACDRIYRVGQTKPVFIYRFITVDTIEERVKLLQEMKLSIAEDVLTGTKHSQVSKLTLNDLKMLFCVDAAPF